MNKRNNFPMNIGLSSILLIFVVLCLISFGVLSIASANADRKLSQKVLNRSISYYNACNQAEDMLKDVDSQLHNAYAASENESMYLDYIAQLHTVYTYSVSDLQELQVILDYPTPVNENGALYKIKSWKVVNPDDLEYDEQLHVIP